MPPVSTLYTLILHTHTPLHTPLRTPQPPPPQPQPRPHPGRDKNHPNTEQTSPEMDVILAVVRIREKSLAPLRIDS